MLGVLIWGLFCGRMTGDGRWTGCCIVLCFVEGCGIAFCGACCGVVVEGVMVDVDVFDCRWRRRWT